MVNKRKVRLMARTAMYEKHEGGAELKTASYYRGDYVGLHMLLAGIGITIAYLLALVLICVYRFEYILGHLTELNYRKIGSTALIVYVLLLIAFQVISYFVYSIRYNENQSGIKLYLNRLKKIDKMNREDKEGGRMEGEKQE